MGCSRPAPTSARTSPRITGFYGFPRKVVHIDDGAIAALRRAVRGGAAAGWPAARSHEQLAQPPAGAAAAGEVIGLGMNAEEMADNPQLTKSLVHDVNRDPRLPFGDAEFDGAMCAVSIQYLIASRPPVPRAAPGTAARRAVRRVLLQPLLSHQGRGRLARHHRPAAPPCSCAPTSRPPAAGADVTRRGPVAGRQRGSALRGLGARRMKTLHIRRRRALPAGRLLLSDPAS